MTPSNEVPGSLTHDEFLIEIVGEDLSQYQESLMAVLERLCLSADFRTSHKSCEFIRHVVHHCLEGEVDELKERLIGMSLLGRDASYDTSTDSGVRVRANDVRKRLGKFNEGEGAAEQFWITLPTGTYVPRFFRTGSYKADHLQASPQEIAPEILHEYSPESLPPSGPRLSLFQLAIPTLVAIFLCIICMRWQLAQEQSFTTFWHEVLQGDQAFLYLTPDHLGAKPGMVAIQDLNEAAPLLDLVAQFDRRFTVVTDPRPVSSSRQTWLYVGLNSTRELNSRHFEGLVPAQRFRLVGEGGDRKVVDSNQTQNVIRHAALLTIVNGPQRSMFIDGTDDNAIRSLVNRLCSESNFPATLATSFRPGTISQAMFPGERYAKGILDQRR